MDAKCSAVPDDKLIACRHLPKCFDNVHNLEFRKDEAGEPTKGAIGMYSGDNAVYMPQCMYLHSSTNLQCYQPSIARKCS